MPFSHSNYTQYTTLPIQYSSRYCDNIDREKLTLLFVSNQRNMGNYSAVELNILEIKY